MGAMNFFLVITSYILCISHPFLPKLRKGPLKDGFKLYGAFLRTTLISLSQFGTAYKRGLARTSLVKFIKYFAILEDYTFY